MSVGFVRVKAVLALTAVALSAMGAERPYELEWAGRTVDDRPVLLPLVDAEGWTVDASNADASFECRDEHCLFGDAVARLNYRGIKGKRAMRMRLSPPSPVAITGAFDTVSVWIYGNHGRKDLKTHPAVSVSAEFQDSQGHGFSVPLYKLGHREWFLVQKKLSQRQVNSVAHGGKFLGFTVVGDADGVGSWIELTSLAVYGETLKPLHFSPRPKRPCRVFPEAPAGVNVGDGELPFPNRKLTVVPEVGSSHVEWRLPVRIEDWSDMAFRGADGAWRPFAIHGGISFAAESHCTGLEIVTNSVSPIDVVYTGIVQVEGAADAVAKLHFHEHGQSLVLDLQVSGECVKNVSFGSLSGRDFPGLRTIPVPYYSYSIIDETDRPHVAVAEVGGKPMFVSATMDWTQSNASIPYCRPVRSDGTLSVNGGVRYCRKTDGRRNPCYERFVWSVSPAFEEVLPSIPNPPSPYRELTADYLWCHTWAGDREKDKEFWKDRKRRRLDRVLIGDHETCMRDGNESFTFRTRPAPKKGGDRGMNDFTRFMIDELGYLYGPYNNYTDFAPINGWWHADRVNRQADGELQPAWNRCYAPKPTFAVEACEQIVPELQRKFRFNSGYCDVHTCVPPWTRCDYDSRVPGAGTFAGTFNAYGELLGLQRKFWGGPVYSEGGSHFMYCGLNDGNFAQDQRYWLDVNPWLVDFDLLKMHPLANNFGMGYPTMFYSSKMPPKGHDEYVDRFLAATIAFGHIGYFMVGKEDDEEKGYWLLQAAASRYAKANACRISYANPEGRWLSTSAAIVSGDYRRSQVSVLYSDGTRTVVNGNRTDAVLPVKAHGRTLAIPRNGWVVESGDGEVVSVSASSASGRADVCVSPGYVYVDGRGNWFDSGFGATDGRLIRIFGKGNEEVFVRHAKEVVLPYVADSAVMLDKDGSEIAAADFSIVSNGTRLVANPQAYSYRLVREDPGRNSAKNVLMAFDRGGAFTIGKRECDESPLFLPQTFVSGMVLRDGSERAIDESTGADVRLSPIKVGDLKKVGYCVRPPHIGSVGATFMRWEIALPDIPVVFHASVGKVNGHLSGDGVEYRIVIVDDAGEHCVAKLMTNANSWKDLEAELSLWRNKRIQLVLAADVGGRDDGIDDYAAWCDLEFRKVR